MNKLHGKHRVCKKCANSFHNIKLVCKGCANLNISSIHKLGKLSLFPNSFVIPNVKLQVYKFGNCLFMYMYKPVSNVRTRAFLL